MTFSQARMVKIVGWVPGHTQALHYTPLRFVDRDSERNDVLAIEPIKREIQRGTQMAPLYTLAQICRETGKEYMVQVHSGEGPANHPGPEPCGGLREGTDEKSVGGHVGGVLRRESC